jgi:hypothetical protein
MSAATDIQSGAAFAPEVPPPSSDDLVEASGDLLAMVSLAHNLPVDFDGCAISVLREPGTNRLLALILSPVDMHAGEPFPRYQVNPHHVAEAKGPKLVLPV